MVIITSFSLHANSVVSIWLVVNKKYLKITKCVRTKKKRNSSKK